ncbi:MAG: hypothetical protein IPO92_00020 [Saprospiraceae bacterium]|nr:hypothetical protein [Saprospiraceae bacterium]
MKLAIEPKEIDLVVEPHKYTKSDTELMSKIIRHYNSTGELLILKKTKAESKPKKELITKP